MAFSLSICFSEYYSSQNANQGEEEDDDDDDSTLTLILWTVVHEKAGN